MKLDPTKMKNWEIAEAAENNIKPIFQLAEEIGLQKDELLPAGHTLGKVHFAKVLDRLKDAPTAKYIDVTAITPTPFGEGKTTTTIGLIQGLAKCGKRPTGAIRQPSAGPTFNVKGGSRRRRSCPVRPSYSVFNPPDRRYRFGYQCSQSLYGRIDCPNAAREKL